MKGQTRFLSVELFAVRRKLRNFGPVHAEIPPWLCGSFGLGEAALLANPLRLRLDFYL